MTDSTIAELYARDPLKHSQQDLDKIIAHLRTQRSRFLAGDLKAGTPNSRAKKPAEETKNLDVDDLLKDIL